MINNQVNKCSRAAALIIHDQSLLLVYHKKPSCAYYVFPGGTVEQNENPATAAIRELHEETSIQADIGQLLYHIHITDGSTSKDEYFFQCTYLSGTPALDPQAIEWTRMATGTDFYEPQWVQIDKLENMLIYPLEIRDWLIQDLKNGLKDKVKEATFMKSSLRQSL